ncbi:MAG: Na+/H+ antiporter subunit D, partial [Phycisphaerales bacterium]|nr:Na+/H+ antiporter subunit D [Phycisphaerales bacterium]
MTNLVALPILIPLATAIACMAAAKAPAVQRALSVAGAGALVAAAAALFARVAREGVVTLQGGACPRPWGSTRPAGHFGAAST